MPSGAPAARTTDLRVHDSGHPILSGVDLVITAGQRWAVLGPNGSGKTTLSRVLAGWLRPSSGSVDLLGADATRSDLRRLRARIGFTSAAVTDLLRPGLAAVDAVTTAPNGALEPWWHTYSAEDRTEAAQLLAEFGVGDLAARRLATLSSGERQRVLLARAFARQPGLVVLDEPTAGLDVGGREDLVARLGRVTEGAEAATVLVTHHLEEIPPGFTHGLLLAAGEVVAAGPIDEVIDGPTLSDLFGLRLEVRRVGGRWSALSPG